MSAATATRGTRWGRSGVLMLLAFVLVATVAGLTRSNVLALTMMYHGSAARFSTEGIKGEDVAIGVSEATVRNSAGVDTRVKVLRAGFAVAELSRLCVSIKQSIPVLGDVVLQVEAGDSDPATYEIKANNIELDILRGRTPTTSGLKLNGSVKIGMATQDLSTVAGVDDPLQQPMDKNGSGYWGIDATQGAIDGLSGHLYDAEIVGSIQLPNLKIKASGSDCVVAPEVLN